MDIVMQRRVTGWPYETPLARGCQVFCIMISGNGFFANLIRYADPPASIGMPYAGLSYTMGHSIIQKVEISYY